MTTEAETLEAYQSGKPLDIDDGAYAATVKEVETVDGEFGAQLRFTFTLDEHPDVEPWLWCSKKLGTLTNLWKYVDALRGYPPTISERLAPRSLVGLRCQVVVGPKRTKAGAEVKGVVNILKAKAAPTPATPKPLEPAPTTPAPELAANCWCGQPVESYSPAGVALCAKHAAELAD